MSIKYTDVYVICVVKLIRSKCFIVFLKCLFVMCCFELTQSSSLLAWGRVAVRVLFCCIVRGEIIVWLARLCIYIVYWCSEKGEVRRLAMCGRCRVVLVELTYCLSRNYCGREGYG